MLSVAGFTQDGFSRPQGLLPLCFFPGPFLRLYEINVSNFYEHVSGTQVLSALEAKTGGTVCELAIMSLGSDIFVWRWRPCLISPQPAVLQARLPACVWRQQASSSSAVATYSALFFHYPHLLTDSNSIKCTRSKCKQDGKQNIVIWLTQKHVRGDVITRIVCSHNA